MNTRDRDLSYKDLSLFVKTQTHIDSNIFQRQIVYYKHLPQITGSVVYVTYTGDPADTSNSYEIDKNLFCPTSSYGPGLQAEYLNK